MDKKLLLLSLFVATQLIGILTFSVAFDETYQDAMVGPYTIERPDVTPTQGVSFLMFGVLIGTGLMFFLIARFPWIIKYWFALALWTTMSLTLTVYTPLGPLVALILLVLRLKHPSMITHNLSELLVYPGLALLFAPMLKIATAVMLLILISIYDAYAVWKSKHMIKLAKAQTKSGVFAGLVVADAPIHKLKPSKKKTKKSAAILGGGDLAFPLIFTGALFPTYGLQTLIIPPLAALGLAYILYYGENKWYPAMPYISAGCLIALSILQLIN